MYFYLGILFRDYPDCLNNLININEIYSELEIKIESFVMNKQTQEVLFKKPFKNTCFGICFCDDGIVNQKPHVIAYDGSTLTEYGFTAVSTHESPGVVLFIAFGY